VFFTKPRLKGDAATGAVGYTNHPYNRKSGILYRQITVGGDDKDQLLVWSGLIRCF
jgi:hypothetical protein